MDFLRSGFTKADLSCFEKTPELSDKLTIRVIIGAMESMQWGSRLDGTGSNKHVDDVCKSAGSNDLKDIGYVQHP